ncbi:Extracellular metalloproteinase MEP [Psilocybe cubensis]|uniref:Extracellular metalloproteinase n=2 Tax=Psilocybe cubensis TaxID=181762 RepID=A0A8H8CFJ6_PSICU|nr:Extracellular metalloproteinase MEP [Psilocybe cubensis]KAH9475195.1 Extracellular metalloproteinase MEP [Psilocybe cubensis]
MRCFLTASLVVASLTGHIYGHRLAESSPLDEGRAGLRRKSLGFGPEHPHAVFKTNPHDINVNGPGNYFSSTPPMQVARMFLRDYLTPSHGSHVIREDSYTDKNTGVTHVYVKQFVNGLEVTDGDMNINIKDGQILSYGDSFFKGDIPAPFSNPAVSALREPRQEACEQLFQSYHTLLRTNVVDSEQVIMGQSPVSADTEAISVLQHIHESNCGMFGLPEFTNTDDIADFRPALLKFMATATPNSKVAADIINRFDHHKDSMLVTPISHFAPSAGQHAIEFTADNVPDSVNPVKAKLAYVQVPNEARDGTELHLVWKFEVEMQDNWYETAVSATAPHQIISVVDWASDAPTPKPQPGVVPGVYNVLKWGVNDPECGERTPETENFDSLASPVGWHSIPYANDPSFRGARLPTKDFYRNTTTTWGNNVFAQENWQGQNSYIDNYRPEAGKSKKFDFEYDPQETEKPDAMDEAQKYINHTISQLFYTTNMVHDLYYRYGFDEVSGNFQQYNFGRGGAQNDAVIANAQDGSGFNNANFMTPPDGQNGRMRMYLWNTAIPYRDGDLEAGIVIHELSHGLSTRLTGGPANSGCLGWGESGGMGEGWGDFLATIIRSKKLYSDYAMGSWAANRANGIRNYPYSLDESINPSTYKTLDKPGYWGVHAIGEVWAEILWVVSQKLIEKHGFTEELYPPSPSDDGTVPLGDFYRADKKGALVPKHGNSLIVQLVINGMKLQTCRPSFFEARDAIIQADQILTGGENFCELWAGFASRGLGPDAIVRDRTPWGGGSRTNGYSVPPACEEYLSKSA